MISALVVEFIIGVFLEAFCSRGSYKFLSSNRVELHVASLLYFSLFCFLDIFDWCCSCFRFIHDLLPYFSLFSYVGNGFLLFAFVLCSPLLKLIEVNNEGN